MYSFNCTEPLSYPNDKSAKFTNITSHNFEFTVNHLRSKFILARETIESTECINNGYVWRMCR